MNIFALGSPGLVAPWRGEATVSSVLRDPSGRPYLCLLDTREGERVEIASGGSVSPDFVEGESVDLEVFSNLNDGTISSVFAVVYDAAGAVRFAAHHEADMHLLSGAVQATLGFDLRFEPDCEIESECFVKPVVLERGRLVADNLDLPVSIYSPVRLMLRGIPYWFELSDARRVVLPPTGRCSDNLVGAFRSFALVRDTE